MSTLSSTGVRLAMFDWHAFAEFLSAYGGRCLLAQTVLQEFVLGDRYGASTVRSCVCALRSQRKPARVRSAIRVSISASAGPMTLR